MRACDDGATLNGAHIIIDALSFFLHRLELYWLTLRCLLQWEKQGVWPGETNSENAAGGNINPQDVNITADSVAKITPPSAAIEPTSTSQEPSCLPPPPPRAIDDIEDTTLPTYESTDPNHEG